MNEINHAVDDLFTGKLPEVRAIYDRLVEEVARF